MKGYDSISGERRRSDDRVLWDEHAPVKSIDYVGSFALITNNICGPAMMSLPSLFRAAGILPTVLMILFIYLCSSLVGVFLAESIQGVRGNREFRRNLDFSHVFGMTVGENWYHVVQVLVIISCISQIFAAIVEVSQALDGFLASFVMGKTYALQLSSMEIIEWSPAACKAASNSLNALHNGVDIDLCTPFAKAEYGVVTLGYLLTTAFFLPLGLGDLKETIGVQIASFIAFFVLIVQFEWEFHNKGFNFVDSVPWIGNDFSQLAGVVLFNYAYPITVPSWLNEKKLGVPASSIIWSTSRLSTIVYIVFGLTAAWAFSDTGADMLVVLSSTQVSHRTQLCAAFFSMAIIGSGAPVFCVIVHSILLGDGHFSPRTCLFLGSIAPYMVALFMYQGHLLMDILNWAGLVVNGLVASILPVVLAYVAYRKRVDRKGADEKGEVVAEIVAAEGEEAVDVVKPLPQSLEPYRAPILLGTIGSFAIIIVSTLVLDIVTGSGPQ